MKYLMNKALVSTTFIFGFIILITLGSCNLKSEKSSSTTFEEKPTTTVIQSEIDTTRKAVPAEQPKEEPKITEESKPLPKVTPKICQPNFTAIGKPKNNRYLFYVTGFNPGEFKCWAAMEEHGQGICQGAPCVIYYLDQAKVPITTTPPHYVDPAILKEHGIGQFEHTTHWWEVKGSKIWGRTGKEFVYYNTNNNAGG